jgi:glycosyltransferase 2 family protein
MPQPLLRRMHRLPVAARPQASTGACRPGLTATGLCFGGRLKHWRIWLGFALSMVLLYLALRGLQLNLVWLALRHADYTWLIPGIVVYFVGLGVRAWRWHYLLRPIKSVSTARLFPITAIGYMGNNIYPVRAGELLRVYLLRRMEAVPISASLATILAERAFDGLVMLGFVFLNLSELEGMTASSGVVGSIRAVAVLGAVIFLLVTLAFLLMALFPALTLRVVAQLVRVLPSGPAAKVSGFFERFLQGLAFMRSPLDLLMVLLTSVVIWLLETGKYWFVMHAFQFRVSFFALMLMNGVVNLATTIPSAPGYIGTFDAPGIAVLQAYGVPANTAAGYTLVLHAALWLPVTLLGLYYMARYSLNLRKVQAEMAQESTT